MRSSAKPYVLSDFAKSRRGGIGAIVFIVIPALALAILVSCNPFAPDEKDFVIQVDSVSAPATVPGGAAFQVKFYGYVGSSGCYNFKEFKVTQSAGSADITVIGHFKDGLCSQ